jgi:hypothetical protein
MERGKKALSPGKGDPYPAIKKNIPLFVASFLNLPDCQVWIHKKALSKVMKLPSGPAFGQRQSLNCLMKGIERGYCGNKKGDHVMLSSIVPDFSQEKNGHRVSWQYNGRPEPFSKGNLMHTALSRPRWFQVGGNPITDVTTQKAIVEELLGEAMGLSEDDKER